MNEEEGGYAMCILFVYTFLNKYEDKSRCSVINIKCVSFNLMKIPGAKGKN